METTTNLRLKVVLGLVVVLTSVTCAQAGGPWCFACTHVFHPAICQSVVECGEHEACHTEKTLNNNGAELYTTSCMDRNSCTTTVRRKRSVSRSLLCDQCCNGTLCNAVGCGAQPIKTPQQRYCLSCAFAKNPSSCDTVDVCSIDKVCSVSADKTYTFPFYNLGCRAKTSCPPPSSTLAQNNNICCDTDLCNSNDLGISPSLYTTTPIPTTRKPAKPVVSFDNSTVEYVVTHVDNETMELICHVTGGPVPTVTWTFDSGNGSVPVTAGISTDPNGDSALSIPMPDKSDSGKYACNATNPLGDDEQVLTVQVLDPPKIEGSLNNSVDAQFQGDITLDCNVTMDNSTIVRWIIPPTVKSYTIHANNSLTLYNVHTENTGEYACVAENADGNTTKTFSIEVNDTSTPRTTMTSCTCPTVTVPSCPTFPSTTPTTTTLTTPTTSTATTLTTPTTSTTTTPSTTPTTAMTPTTSTTTTTPMTTPTTTQGMKTLPTANLQPTNPPLVASTSSRTTSHPATASPVTHLVKDQFQSEKRQVNIMVCPISGPMTHNITWVRLVSDFDHTNPIYIANSNNMVLTISNQMTVLTTGVYECRVGNVPVAQFAVYGNLPTTAQCGTAFRDITQTEGVVMRAMCPPCPNPLSIRPTLKIHITDLICESAIARGIILASGGNVTYLLAQGGNVVLLDENGGDILMR